jgi:hypothetical protein
VRRAEEGDRVSERFVGRVLLNAAQHVVDDAQWDEGHNMSYTPRYEAGLLLCQLSREVVARWPMAVMPENWNQVACPIAVDHRPFAWYRAKGFFWFRAFGWELHVKNWRLHGETFSERTGLNPGIKIGRWRIRRLRP